MEEQKCDPCETNYDGDEPIHHAARCGQLDTIRYFITELKCDPNAPGGMGEPVRYAARSGHLAIVKYFMEECNCDAMYKEQIGCITPLYDAATLGHLDIVQYLVTERKMDPFCCISGYTPLRLAAENNRIDVVRFLAKEFVTALFWIIATNNLFTAGLIIVSLAVFVQLYFKSFLWAFLCSWYESP